MTDCINLETNHTNFYLEDEVKQNLCHEECLDAASNLEKQILDLAKSNIGYKAQIIKRRKEIETETKNFNLHDSFKVQKQAEIAVTGANFFKKASEIITENDISPTKKKILPFEPVEKPKKKQSTLSSLKKLKKRGTETPKKKNEKLSNSELSLLDKYLNKAKIHTSPDKHVPESIGPEKPVPESKSPEKTDPVSEENTSNKMKENQEEFELEKVNSDSERDKDALSGTQRETNNDAEVKFIIPSRIKPSILTSKSVDSARQNRLMRLKRPRSPDPTDRLENRVTRTHLGKILKDSLRIERFQSRGFNWFT